jgi:hypothetical protein
VSAFALPSAAARAADAPPVPAASAFSEDPPSPDADTPCTACGRPVGDHAWVVAGGRGFYCDSCMKTSTPCSACGAPVRTLSLRDGRAFCPDCAATLVEDGAVVSALYAELLDAAEARLGLRLRQRPKLLLESSAVLRAQEGSTTPPEGLCGLFVRHEGGATIHILMPLPRARLLAVLAHEIGHAWQAESCADEQGPRLREGFAEWVSWHLLEGREGCETERRVIAQRKDTYGDGFRVFLGLEERAGTAAAVWYAAAARNRT